MVCEGWSCRVTNWFMLSSWQTCNHQFWTLCWNTGTLDTGQLDSYLDDKAHWMNTRYKCQLLHSLLLLSCCMSLHITKLTWPLYIFKAHMAHIKFSLTKSWTFKSGSLPLILLTLASWLFEHSFLRSPKAMCRFRSPFVHLRLLVRELYAVKALCLHRWG